MSLAAPVSSLRDRQWARLLGGGLIAFAVVLIVAAPVLDRIPVLASTASIVAGFAIGFGYQFQPFLHRGGSRSPRRKLGGWLVVGSAFGFVSAVIVVALGWAPRVGGLGLALLAISICAMLVGLTELYPEGDNLPGLFLVPVGLDGLMLQSMAPLWSNPQQVGIALALFAPGTCAAVVLTIWAFRVRSANRVVYARATETARGVLWAWGLLVVGVLIWTWFGVGITDTTWVNPVAWGLPLVTVGSVLATATAGWTKYLEARNELTDTRL